MIKELSPLARKILQINPFYTLLLPLKARIKSLHKPSTNLKSWKKQITAPFDPNYHLLSATASLCHTGRWSVTPYQARAAIHREASPQG